jgi:hypothetical protein
LNVMNLLQSSYKVVECYQLVAKLLQSLFTEQDAGQHTFLFTLASQNFVT